jgi:SUMO ligase MMS21 Smc5/6 complex component
MLAGEVARRHLPSKQRINQRAKGPGAMARALQYPNAKPLINEAVTRTKTKTDTSLNSQGEIIMTTLKTRLMSAVAVAAMALSPLTAQASWMQPDLGDCEFAIDHITAEVSQLVAMVTVKASNIKVVYLEDILSASDLADVDADLKNFTTQLELVTLKNSLNNAKVLNGSDITLFKDFLNGNDIDVSDVIGLEVFRDGRVLLLCCEGGTCD